LVVIKACCLRLKRLAYFLVVLTGSTFREIVALIMPILGSVQEKQTYTLEQTDKPFPSLS
jgi:hypothetical protein